MAVVALINPKAASRPWGARMRTMEDAQPRHSLTHLSAVLKRAGHTVTLVDSRELSGWDEFRLQLLAQPPDFACITAHTLEAGQALECARVVKTALPRCRVVAGGIHFTMFPEPALHTGSIDYVIRGEGELTLPSLVANPLGHSPISWGVPPDLDSLPFEDRSLYPDYKDRIHFPVWDLATPILDLLTGRGCPWQCRFCCGPGEQNLYTRPSRKGSEEERAPHLRRRSVGHVLEEIRVLEADYRFRSLIFHDDQFLIQREWVEEFCSRMIECGYPGKGVRWWAACRADMICRFPNVIKLMKEAGLAIVSIGFESFSDPILEWMAKGTDRATNLRAGRICHDLGLDIYANVLFGLPRETGKWHFEDDLASFEALRQMRPKYVSSSYFSPIPGSWFYEWAVGAGVILDESEAAAGDRNPDRKRIKGVDYVRLNSLVRELNSRAGRPVYDRLRFYRFLVRKMIRRLKP